MSDVDTRLKAMAHEGRRIMVRNSLGRERSASDLADLTGLSRPAASQHLSLLLNAGLMSVRSDGRRRWYRADTDALDELRTYLDGFWMDRLSTLKREAES